MENTTIPSSPENSLNQQNITSQMQSSSPQMPTSTKDSHTGGILLTVLGGLFIVIGGTWVVTGNLKRATLKPNTTTSTSLPTQPVTGAPSATSMPSVTRNPIVVEISKTPSVAPTTQQLTDLSTGLLSKDKNKISQALGIDPQDLDDPSIQVLAQYKSFTFDEKTFQLNQTGRTGTIQTKIVHTDNTVENKKVTLILENGKWFVWYDF